MAPNNAAPAPHRHDTFGLALPIELTVNDGTTVRLLEKCAGECRANDQSCTVESMLSLTSSVWIDASAEAVGPHPPASKTSGCGQPFTYEGQGAPLLRLARSTWTVTPEGTRTLK